MDSITREEFINTLRERGFRVMEPLLIQMRDCCDVERYIDRVLEAHKRTEGSRLNFRSRRYSFAI